MNRTSLQLYSLLLTSSFALFNCGQRGNDAHDEFPSDAEAIATGARIFNENCSSCHTIDRDAIGPALGGVTSEVSAQWLKNFIRDPRKVIESGDARATALFAQYKSVMPSFSYYKEDEVQGILAYLHTQKSAVRKMVAVGDSKPVEDPIAEGIRMSDLVVDLDLIAELPTTADEPPRTRITKFCSRPDTKEFYVLDLRGKLYRLEGRKTETYMDMASLRPRFIHKPGHATGFGSFAFHPEFARNGLLYTTHTEDAEAGKPDFFYDDSLRVKLQWVLTEWKTDTPGAFPFKGEGRELLRINMFGQSHGVQEITFNPFSNRGDEDFGLLYIGIGDGGSAEKGILHINKGPEHIWSSIIRIDPAGRNSSNGKYGIPQTNPFVGSSNPRALGEVYAYGFRNPHRISWTRKGQMLASNIGQHNIEELNLILPGHDYGWPTREGSFVIDLKENTRALYPLTDEDARFNLDYPVAEYDHDEGNAIIGGYEYRGSTITELQGKYLFGDMVNGRLFYVELADVKPGSKAPMREFRIALNGKTTSFKEQCDAERLSVRFGQDHLGEIYVSTMPDGRLYKLTGAHRDGVALSQAK